MWNRSEELFQYSTVDFSAPSSAAADRMPLVTERCWFSMCWLDVLADSGVTAVACNAKMILLNNNRPATIASSVCACPRMLPHHHFDGDRFPVQ
ncbi:hypothetical protein ACFQL1_15160 [Halomicroarcula sp. GCM10025709]|uniref:hypothetical protein n=1 Tax=Halomicroarcula sp. GCM10025709 TaxID=3252669 RepID=UPI003613766D